ncbi:MAG TPA: hypothetical protein VNK96_10275 [Fimbriimonadales bacterium]|nr:hypothetical protein [Fimbriimonadales bacterium]
MKKIASLSLFSVLFVWAYAQAPFTIVKPAEGQTVREVIKIVLPKGSVPRGTYIGVSLDGKFIEATRPVYDKKLDALVYALDSKAHRIADGKHTIALVLYAQQDGKPIVADRTEVTVNVDNTPDIKIPKDGIQVNYKFKKGMTSIYRLDVLQLVSTLTEAKNRMGGKAAEFPVGIESSRFLVAVDDVKPDGSGLVRIQVLPNPGKDYAVISVGGKPPAKYTSETFAPLYRLIKPNGAEVYADAPTYFPVEGQTGTFNPHEIYLLLPLPQLPTDKVKPGDRWQTAILFNNDLEEILKTGKSVVKIPARGEFVGVEWERGKPCARLKYSLELAERAKETDVLELQGREFKFNEKLRFVEDVWVSLDDGKLVRMDSLIEADFKVPVGSTGGAAAGGAQAGAGTSAGGPTAAGATSAGGGRTTGAGTWATPPQTDLKGGGQRGGLGTVGTTPPGAATGQGRAGARTTYVYIREKFLFKVILEG